MFVDKDFPTNASSLISKNLSKLS